MDDELKVLLALIADCLHRHDGRRNPQMDSLTLIVILIIAPIVAAILLLFPNLLRRRKRHSSEND